jgi:hypothetical protein
MNKGLLRIVVGVIAGGLGFYQIFSTKEEIEILQLVLAGYGLFSIGMGIYYLQKEKKQKENS